MRKRRVGTLRTTREAAIRLRLSPKTLRNYRVAGGGPEFVRIGNRVFYPEDGLEAYIAARLFGMTGER